MKQCRLGHINYVNSLPIYDAIFENEIDFSGEIISAHPAELNKMVMQGQLDISPISSIEYARNQDQLQLLNGLCINSHGAVYSVLLASSSPILELNNKKIGLTENSSTAQALVRVLLEKKYGFQCEYVKVPFNNCGLLENVNAELIIGDAAFLYRDKFPFCYDLADEWLKASNQSIVFAVWVVRKEFAVMNPDIVKSVEDKLLQSYRRLNKERIIEKAQKVLRLNRNDIELYFKALGYDFNDNMKKSLLYFYQMASEIGLSPECKQLNFWDAK